MSSTHSSFYALAELYEMAFSYRDLEKECDFLMNIYSRLVGSAPKSILEVAAGPASHARILAGRGLRSAALDNSPDMIRYARNCADLEGRAVDYFEADMRSFAVKDRFDLAVCLLDSLGYLCTNESLYSHFRSVAEVLEKKGIYIIELEHPKYILGLEERLPVWEIKNSRGIVRLQWGKNGEKLDPITQCREVTAILDFEAPDGTSLRRQDTSMMRGFTATEFLALVEASGCFRLVERFGDFDVSCAVNDVKAWRMICVLQKI